MRGRGCVNKDVNHRTGGGEGGQGEEGWGEELHFCVGVLKDCCLKSIFLRARFSRGILGMGRGRARIYAGVLELEGWQAELVRMLLIVDLMQQQLDV